MSSTGRADGPSNPGDGGETRFEAAEGVDPAPVPDSGDELITRTDAENIGDEAEPPD